MESHISAEGVSITMGVDFNYAYTQGDFAKMVGRIQPVAANKKCMVKLKIRELVFHGLLTERHAKVLSKALVKVETEDRQWALLQTVLDKKLGVRATEELLRAEIDGTPWQNPEPGQRILRIVKDVRIFVNTVGELAKEMKRVGLDVKMDQVQDDDAITVTLVFPKSRQILQPN